VSGPTSTLDPGAAGRCAFRTVLEHDHAVEQPGRAHLDESIRRRSDAAGRHRRNVVAELLELHGDCALDANRDPRRTLDAMRDTSLVVIVSPMFAPDHVGRRRGAPSLLVGSHDDGTARWRPVDIHNHFLTAEGATELRASALLAPSWEASDARAERRLRRGGAWRGDLLRLAHHHRQLERLGVAASGAAVAGVVDRSVTLWWFGLDVQLDDLGPTLAQYDARFAERVTLLEQTEARNADPSRPRPGAPWWHRECEACPFEARCHDELVAHDDVSLVRFTSAHDQQVLRTHGIDTRTRLAALDLGEVAAGTATRDEPSDPQTPVGIAVGRVVSDADRLVRRARAEVHGAPLLLVAPDQLTAHRRDVEIDFDMESYENATYVWGSLVTARVPTPGVVEGYRAFAEWGELTDRSEAALFGRFYAWLVDTVATAEATGATVGLYCFYEHAELTQMRRAMSSDAPGLPSPEALEALLDDRLVDLHRVVTTQIQTAGTAGLKVIAMQAGFSWRDDAPSGEASMAWYESAKGADAAAANAAMRRLLEYNEDDCRATRALRDWLGAGARELCDLEGARPAEP
jgi:predicted RecB family nuclease